MTFKRTSETSPKVLVVLGFVLLAWLAPKQAHTQVPSALIEDYIQQIRHATGAPGISVAVAQKGKIVFSKGVGFAELENLSPATGSTVLNAGSVSKVMAAVALMQLVAKGKVGLDDNIQKYVPSFPEKRAPITLKQILTHTSGIRHYKKGEFGPYGLREMRRFDNMEEAIKHFSEDPLLFEPGRYWSYSSHAFNLLQGVIEKASGLSFEEYMRLNVWEPAGMLQSSFDVPERIVHKRGRGYVRNRDGVLVNTRYVDVSYKYAGGGMLTTVEDLVRFGTALNDGTLLDSETVATMYTVAGDPVMRFRADRDPIEESYKQALGWRIDQDAQGRSYINHTGTVKGTRTFILNYPEEDLVLAVQANVVPFDSRKHGVAMAQMFLPPVH